MHSRLERVRTQLAEFQLFESKQSRRRFLLHLLVLVVAFGAAVLIVRRHLSFLRDAEALREFVAGYGVLAPLVLILLQAVQVVAAPIPGQVLAVVAGYVFGTWLGTLYNMIGIMIGSTVAFWLSRRYGRAYVENIVHDEALAQFDSVSEDYAAPALFFFFLVPGLPDDVLCFAGGLTDIPLWKLIVIALVGRAPGFFLANVFGDLLGTDQFGPALALAVGLLVLSVLGYLYRDRVIRLFGRGR
ncbi:TVP38/TMEM64 family protein [Haloarchaeobius iranensis]|nr:TVP38/TMEM64 family protein [Haloarchaeobius iranensis]